jgi:hypothetical protein
MLSAIQWKSGPSSQYGIKREKSHYHPSTKWKRAFGRGTSAMGLQVWEFSCSGLEAGKAANFQWSRYSSLKICRLIPECTHLQRVRRFFCARKCVRLCSCWRRCTARANRGLGDGLWPQRRETSPRVQPGYLLAARPVLSRNFPPRV